MTLVHGVALDPESGDPIAGRQVSATVWPVGSTVPPIAGGVDQTVTDSAGNWQLTLPPTAGHGAVMRIRVWRDVTLYVDVPATVLGAPPVEAVDYLVNPDTLAPSPPPAGSVYLARAERGAPGGVASLDSSGSVPISQLPILEGTDGQLLLTRQAAVTLGGHRVVTPLGDNTLAYASNTDPAHLEAPLWMTLGAIIAGDSDSVLAYGPVSEPSWQWTAGPVYLATGGQLTQSPPSAPAALFSARIGYAISPTRLFFDRRSSIRLTQGA
jgi:hypothetical protein